MTFCANYWVIGSFLKAIFMKNSQYFCPNYLIKFLYQNNNEYFYLRQQNFQNLKISSHL